VASVWEAVIKYALGKLPLPDAPAQYLPQQRQAHRIAPLPLEEAALAHLARLPPFTAIRSTVSWLRRHCSTS
jgi:PIN domain nuclease of toxin-antitoxin system